MTWHGFMILIKPCTNMFSSRCRVCLKYKKCSLSSGLRIKWSKYLFLFCKTQVLGVVIPFYYYYYICSHYTEIHYVRVWSLVNTLLSVISGDIIVLTTLLHVSLIPLLNCAVQFLSSDWLTREVWCRLNCKVPGSAHYVGEEAHFTMFVLFCRRICLIINPGYYCKLYYFRMLIWKCLASVIRHLLFSSDFYYNLLKIDWQGFTAWHRIVGFPIKLWQPRESSNQS